MIETLLIIALVIAIFLDFVRICQYIQMRKLIDRDNEIAFRDRINKLHHEWDEGTFGDYCLKHWKE